MELARTRIPTREGRLHRKELRRMVLLLAWPAIVEMFLATLVQFVDTAMVGSLGAVAIAATGLSGSPLNLLNGLFAALGVGSTALVARFTGAGDRESANKTAQQSLLVGVTLSLLVTGLVMAFAPLIPIVMGAEPEVIPVASAYLRILSVTFILAFSAFILNGVLRAPGIQRRPCKHAGQHPQCRRLFPIYPTRRWPCPAGSGGRR